MRRLASIPIAEAMLWRMFLRLAPAFAVTVPTSDTGEPSEVAVSSATLKGSAYPVRPTGSCLQHGARRVARPVRLGRIRRRGLHRAEVLAAGGAQVSDRRRAILLG